jgi:hypothetical protein
VVLGFHKDYETDDQFTLGMVFNVYRKTHSFNSIETEFSSMVIERLQRVKREQDSAKPPASRCSRHEKTRQLPLYRPRRVFSAQEVCIATEKQPAAAEHFVLQR